jgi:hypothetical protein
MFPAMKMKLGRQCAFLGEQFACVCIDIIVLRISLKVTEVFVIGKLVRYCRDHDVPLCINQVIHGGTQIIKNEMEERHRKPNANYALCRGYIPPLLIHNYFAGNENAFIELLKT